MARAASPAPTPMLIGFFCPLVVLPLSFAARQGR